MTRFTFLWVGTLVLASSCLSFGQALTLREVLMTIKQVNPRLQSFDQLVKAKQGAARQADVRLNPIVGTSAGNRVQVIKIGQELEYSGKRAARTHAALEEVEAAKSELDLATIELEQEVAKLFHDVLWAQGNLELLRDNLRITGKFSEAAAYKLDRGFGSKLEVVKGQVEVARARRLLKAAEKALVDNQNRLKILLRQASSSPLLLQGDLAQSEFYFTNNLDSLLLLAEQRHPAIQVAEHRMKAAQQQVVVAQLSSKPNFDFELAGGMEEREAIVELSLSLPLSLWDNKSGAKAEAQFQQKSLEYSVEQVRNTLKQQITTAFLEYQTTVETARLFEGTLLHEAKEAAGAAQKAFEAGGFRFLDLIDAQRTYLEASLEYYESLRALRHAETDLRSAVGISMQ